MREFPTKISIGGVDKVSAVIDKVQKKFPELHRAATRGSLTFAAYNAQTAKVTKTLTAIGNKTASVGKALTVGVTLPVLAAGGYAVKSFMDYEQALVGLGKTTNLRGKELEDLGKKFQQVSTTMPATTNELLALGQTAAQLGVKGNDNILKFSETLAKLQTATNIVGEEGATDLARFISVTKSNIGDVENFGSALVAMGNNFELTERELLSFSTRMGAATAIYNVGATNIMGIATTLQSLGIEAEAGSSSVQRAFAQIDESITKGGKKAQALSVITGIAVGDLKEQFGKDSAGVFKKFVEGLARLEKQGVNLGQAFDYFQLSGVRDIQTLGSLVKNTDKLDKAMKMSAESFKANNALTEEFAQFNETAASKMARMRNQITVTSTELGQNLMPAVLEFLTYMNKLAKFLADNPAFTAFIFKLALVAAAFGPILWFIGKIITAVSFLITLWGYLSTAVSVIAWVFGVSFGVAFGWIALIVVAIGGLIALVWKFRDAIMKGIVWAFNKVIEAITFLLEKMQAVTGWIRNSPLKYTPLGMMATGLNMGLNTVLGEQGAPQNLSPARQEDNLVEMNAKANTEFLTNTNNARVDVFVRAPESTRVVGEGENGVLALNRGLMGAF